MRRQTQPLKSTEWAESLERQQYSRYAMYTEHVRFITEELLARLPTALHIIEFGGSNGFIASIFDGRPYEVAPNAPDVDLHDLSGYDAASYDVVVLDEILEHVRKPWVAIKEVHRILKPVGCLITSSPFMIAEHKCPEDYWRFTADGLRVLLEEDSDVRVQSWGNQAAVSYLMNDMMVTAEQARGDGKFDLANVDRFAVTIWAYAWK